MACNSSLQHVHDHEPGQINTRNKWQTRTSCPGFVAREHSGHRALEERTLGLEIHVVEYVKTGVCRQAPQIPSGARQLLSRATLFNLAAPETAWPNDGTGLVQQDWSTEETDARGYTTKELAQEGANRRRRTGNENTNGRTSTYLNS